jgi:DHA1 family multidrug resistance protein-like MFS transporter
MAPDIIRDSTFGQLVRLATKGRFFPYPEETDQELWKKFVNEETSGNMARFGEPKVPEGEGEGQKAEEGEGEKEGERGDRGANGSTETSRTRVEDGSGERGGSVGREGEGERNWASGRMVDVEKGKDKYVIDWYGSDDPEVSYVFFLRFHFSFGRSIVEE